MTPTVSVLLPAFDGERYIGAAIESVLAQTYRDFELIVIDDGSRDGTLEAVRRFADSRIRIVTQLNRGLAGTLNRGIALAAGRYVARQDQDDLSFPGRLARQVAHLDSDPTCALVGTWAEIWRGDTLTGRQHRHPVDDATLKFELLLDNPFVHSSVMIRREALDRVGGYSTDAARQPPEDYELWSRIARGFGVANIPEVLHVYREVEGSLSREGPTPFMERLVTLSAENIALAAQLPPDDPHATNIAALTHRAVHRLRGRPDFGAMKRVFTDAARHVAAADDRDRIAAEAGRRMDRLRYRHLELMVPDGLARALLRFAGRAARALRIR